VSLRGGLLVEEGFKCRIGILIGGRSRCKSGLVEEEVKLVAA
jgi:hypothetical protein